MIQRVSFICLFLFLATVAPLQGVDATQEATPAPESTSINDGYSINTMMYMSTLLLIPVAVLLARRDAKIIHLDQPKDPIAEALRRNIDEVNAAKVPLRNQISHAENIMRRAANGRLQLDLGDPRAQPIAMFIQELTNYRQQQEGMREEIDQLPVMLRRATAENKQLSLRLDATRAEIKKLTSEVDEKKQ